MANVVEFRCARHRDPRPPETSAMVEGELCDNVGLRKLIDDWIVPKLVDEWIKQTPQRIDPSETDDKGERP